MKKTLSLLFAVISVAALSLGCMQSGPGEATVEESQESMDASMEIDTMAETMDVDSGDAAPAGGATTEADAGGADTGDADASTEAGTDP